MSKQNKKNKTSAVFGPFGGIDTRAPHTGKPTAADIVNFRLGKDGSLIKRCGYHYVCPLSDAIRAVWTGKLFGSTYILLLEGSSVIRMDSKVTERIAIGNVQQTEGQAQFCFYRDRLYLFADQQIYEIAENAIIPIEPYVPLIGKDWNTTYVGEIFEPRNLLTRRARIEYLVEEEVFSVFFRTKWSVESIQAVYINDTLASSDRYFYDDPSKSIIIQNLSAGTRIRVYLTYAPSNESEMAQKLLSCSRVDVFGDSANNRLFLWDGNEKNIFFTSSYVSPESLAAAKAFYPNCLPLYFPEHSECILGDGRYDITGFVRQYDRLLIFTESDTWMLDTETLNQPHISPKPIHPLLGCATAGAYAMAENAPITVGHHDLYQWSTDTDEYSECNAHSISEPIRKLLEESFFSTARVFHYRAQGEIWFYSPTIAPSIWIYRIADGIWYRFSDISADIFFENDNRLFFSYGSYLFVFNEDYYDDINQRNLPRAILASYTSNLLDYGTPDEKHFSGLGISADCGGGMVRVCLLGDGLDEINVPFYETSAHTMAYRRLNSGRFRYATLQIVAGSNQRQIIHSLVSEVR